MFLERAVSRFLFLNTLCLHQIRPIIYVCIDWKLKCPPPKGWNLEGWSANQKNTNLAWVGLTPSSAQKHQQHDQQRSLWCFPPCFSETWKWSSEGEGHILAILFSEPTKAYCQKLTVLTELYSPPSLSSQRRSMRFLPHRFTNHKGSPNTNPQGFIFGSNFQGPQGGFIFEAGFIFGRKKWAVNFWGPFGGGGSVWTKNINFSTSNKLVKHEAIRFPNDGKLMRLSIPTSPNCFQTLKNVALIRLMWVNVRRSPAWCCGGKARGPTGRRFALHGLPSPVFLTSIISRTNSGQVWVPLYTSPIIYHITNRFRIQDYKQPQVPLPQLPLYERHFNDRAVCLLWHRTISFGCSMVICRLRTHLLISHTCTGIPRLQRRRAPAVFPEGLGSWTAAHGGRNFVPSST